MTSNNRQLAPSKTEAMDSRVLVRNGVTLCIAMSVVLALLVVARSFGPSRGSDKLTALASDYAATEDACSKALSGSEELREYISGRIEYSDISDSGTPARVFLKTRYFIQYSRDSERPKGAEDDELVLELRDALGRSLKSVNFYIQPEVWHIDPDPEAFEENPNLVTWFKDADFDIFIENPPNYASMAILYDGNELEIEEHSANSPCLSVDWQIEDQVLNDDNYISVSFHASDVDGDDLFYSVLHLRYSGMSYRSKLSGTVESKYSSVDIPVTSLGGASRSRLAVMVTDGTRTVFIKSPPFAVVVPPVLTTTIPVNQPPVAIDDGVIKAGSGNDTVTGTNKEDTIIEDSFVCLRLGRYSYQTAKTLLTLLFC